VLNDRALSIHMSTMSIIRLPPLMERGLAALI
jgi:hypothetical protein